MLSQLSYIPRGARRSRPRSDILAKSAPDVKRSRICALAQDALLLMEQLDVLGRGLWRGVVDEFAEDGLAVL